MRTPQPERTPFALPIGMSDNNQGSGAGASRSVSERVIDIVSEKTETPAERIDRETRLFDMTDSLGAVEIVMELEDEFEGSIPDDVSDTIQTVGQLIDYVEAHFVPAPSAP